MRPLIENSLNGKLDDIVTFCFLGNRICDRAMSVLDVKFAMNQTSSILHSKLAHLFPLLADVVSDYQSSRNNLTVYGETPKDDADYASPKEFFEKMLDYMQELESMCYEAYDMADESCDLTTISFLQKFSRLLIPVTSQCILLLDKSNLYNDNWMFFDRDVEHFITLKDFDPETKKWKQ